MIPEKIHLPADLFWISAFADHDADSLNLGFVEIRQENGGKVAYCTNGKIGIRVPVPKPGKISADGSDLKYPDVADVIAKTSRDGKRVIRLSPRLLNKLSGVMRNLGCDAMDLYFPEDLQGSAVLVDGIKTAWGGSSGNPIATAVIMPMARIKSDAAG